MLKSVLLKTSEFNTNIFNIEFVESEYSITPKQTQFIEATQIGTTISIMLVQPPSDLKHHSYDFLEINSPIFFKGTSWDEVMDLGQVPHTLINVAQSINDTPNFPIHLLMFPKSLLAQKKISAKKYIKAPKTELT